MDHKLLGRGEGGGGGGGMGSQLGKINSDRYPGWVFSPLHIILGNTLLNHVYSNRVALQILLY